MCVCVKFYRSRICFLLARTPDPLRQTARGAPCRSITPWPAVTYDCPPPAGPVGQLIAKDQARRAHHSVTMNHKTTTTTETTSTPGGPTAAAREAAALSLQAMAAILLECSPAERIAFLSSTPAGASMRRACWKGERTPASHPCPGHPCYTPTPLSN